MTFVDSVKYRWLELKAKLGLSISPREELLILAGRIGRLADNLTEDDLR